MRRHWSQGGGLGWLGLALIAVVAAGCKGKAAEAPAAGKTEPAAAQPKEQTPKLPSAGELEKKAKGTSAEAAAKFTHWTPVPSFLASPMAAGSVVSSKEAIVFTRDNTVGVTLDGGASWAFSRSETGSIRAVAGASSGPFVAVGAGGYLSVSADGRSWSDLPRYTNDDLIAVAVTKTAIAATGKQGTVLKADATGSNARVTMLPNKFKASGIAFGADKLVVWAGKKGYDSADAETWTPAASLPVAAGKEFPTSHGLCGLGKVEKKKGVVCNVAGTAYGIAENQAVVVGKAWIAVTRDGNSWNLAPLPMKSIKGVAGKAGGPFSVFDSKGVISTTDDGGKTWKESADAALIAEAPQYGKPTKCDGRLPAAAEACTLARAITSPPTLPDVTSVTFVGNIGLAMGNAAMAAMTNDGGATWVSTSGFNLGGLSAYDLRGDRIIALGKLRGAASIDAGKTFHAIEFPPKTPVLFDAHLASDGSAYAAGKAGTILKSEGGLAAWVRLDTGAKNKTDYVTIFDVGSAVYVAGSRGELHRSGDGGKTWTGIATGVPEVVRKMTGEGKTVLAVTQAGRFGGNKLLRSTDDGLHFSVQREISDKGSVTEFEFSGGVLRYGNLNTADYGATWTRNADWYWPGSVDVGDGSGMRVTNVRSYQSKDRFYVIGPTKDDYTIVDSFFNNGGTVLCGAKVGCWLLAGGQLYQPR